jgi:ABC-2 type transport system ATP-binding protein
MSSHNLGEVSRLAERIGIIHEGRLIQELDTETLHRNRRRRLLLKTRDIDGALGAVTGAGYDATKTDDGCIEMTAKDAIEHPDAVNAALVEKGYSPVMLNIEEEDLEAYFLRLIGIKDEVVR